jgi:hypothetical protein
VADDFGNRRNGGRLVWTKGRDRKGISAAGPYVFNEQAVYDPANDSLGSGDCMFSGEWDHMWDRGASAPIGVTIPIAAGAPINGPAETATFQAGNYRVYIYPGTTCSWSITLLPGN